MPICIFGGYCAGVPRNRRAAAAAQGPKPPTFLTSPALLTTPVVGSVVGFSVGNHGGTLPITVATRFLLDGGEVGADGDSTYAPQVADVGKSLRIRVRLTNAAEANVERLSDAALVQAAPTDPGEGDGTATLTWDAPLFDGDGTTLTDLAGYRIYWSQTYGGTGNSVTVNNPATLTATIAGLTPGRWYFMLAALDSGGNESNLMASREGYFKDIA